MWYFMILSCIDTVEVILRDCCHTDTGTGVKTEKVAWRGSKLAHFSNSKPCQNNQTILSISKQMENLIYAIQEAGLLSEAELERLERVLEV